LDSIVKKRLQHKGRVHEDGSVEIKGFAAEKKKNDKDMVQDDKYFDNLFAHWYENQKAKCAVKN
jgi:hypothetical protein